MNLLDLFNDDERQYLNSISVGHDPAKLTKQDVLSYIAFAREIADTSDQMILDLVDSTYSKVNSLTNTEWNDLRLLLPFPVNISFEDNVDEVPEDAPSWDDEDVKKDDIYYQAHFAE